MIINSYGYPLITPQTPRILTLPYFEQPLDPVALIDIEYQVDTLLPFPGECSRRVQVSEFNFCHSKDWFALRNRSLHSEV